MFVAQMTFMLGVKISNPVIGSAWQPSQVVWALLISFLLRYESISCLKCFGILSCVFGGAFMVLFRSNHMKNINLGGNILFCVNCMCSSM